MAKTKVVYRSRPKAKRHRRSHPRIPLAIVAGFAPVATRFAVNAFKGEGIEYASKRVLEDMTGYRVEDGRWTLGSDHTARYGLYPVLAGFGLHWLAGRLGINRMIARSGIPLVSI